MYVIQIERFLVDCYVALYSTLSICLLVSQSLSYVWPQCSCQNAYQKFIKTHQNLPNSSNITQGHVKYLILHSIFEKKDKILLIFIENIDRYWIELNGEKLSSLLLAETSNQWSIDNEKKCFSFEITYIYWIWQSEFSSTLAYSETLLKWISRDSAIEILSITFKMRSVE